MNYTADTLFDIELFVGDERAKLESDSSIHALLPTIQASDCHRQTTHPKNLTNFGGNPTLLGAVHLLPTPTTADTRPSRTPEQIAIARRAGGCSNLRETVINDIKGVV